MRNTFILSLAAICWLLPGDASAKIRIYGGPVQSAGSGRYYPPNGYYGGYSEGVSWVGGLYPGYPGTYRRGETPVDLNPLFVPGTAFVPPGYIPAYYPRSSYFAYDYFGYHFGSAIDP